MEYKQEIKICQSCKKDFTIEPEDFKFYEKIKVPAPTWCPECRSIRRLAFREDRSIYKGECKKCKKNIISIYNPETSFIIYCSECWWGDSWDGIEYGKNYDSSKSFLEQFYELLKIVPYAASSQKGSINCNYSNGNTRCKNCTLTFDGFESIDCYNCQVPIFTSNSFDSDGTMNADHVYQNLYSNSVYNTKFTYFSDECFDCSFLFNCIGCSNCFGCVNLRNQKYCIFNKQYSKEEYKIKIKDWNLGSNKIVKKAKEKFLELYYKTPRRFASTRNSVNISGDDIQNTKNCHVCFSTLKGVEDCKYVYLGGLLLKDSYDVTFGGDISELLYEVNGSEKSQKSLFSRGCNDSSNIEYSDRVYNCQNCFGCTKLRNKKYCILNKQYTKEEYEELLPKIKQHMNDMPYVDKKGRIYKYGEYFPSEFSYWGYNETMAQRCFPLTKEEALEKGFNWYDKKETDYKITLESKDLPDHISNVTDSILEEIIECEHKNGCNEQCTEAFRILPNELEFYKQMNIALPHLCPSCRYGERTKKKNPPKLWYRKCMCNGVESEEGIYKNTIKHLHGDKPCLNEFETAISPEKREIVYCEKCYQAEFI
ncbi:hypothetical protein COW91_03540 [Candidatus Nomurabacteria bacterium CG22_combo_CG10-13_8_21_14_all_32_8]|uniref:Uncharacterized protein n=2 Tax=Candidatus Nomuraibacteriota TaxID=1752729 RepID=A0A2H0CFL1_9BACT|nr:MAG: hypothetical protein COW91_03540 [Candidatus Nomurabacteria bacterium CG22_combo_CG10-13_8_21_14_all_32_8]PIZ85697.1 MAG: hypothetical protein COX94_02230 [Candidatus Nomurabacteria bacterium CG_4_10_14_0_2_um_filter_33_9]